MEISVLSVLFQDRVWKWYLVRSLSLHSLGSCKTHLNSSLSQQYLMTENIARSLPSVVSNRVPGRNVAVRDVTVITELVKTHPNQSPCPSPFSLPTNTELGASSLGLCLYRSHFHRTQLAHTFSISAFIFMNQDVSSIDSCHPTLNFGQQMTQD